MTDPYDVNNFPQNPRPEEPTPRPPQPEIPSPGPAKPEIPSRDPGIPPQRRPSYPNPDLPQA